ncbi:MAG: alpha/beta hydrolase fold domain-containing protein [Microbacterium sp.]
MPVPLWIADRIARLMQRGPGSAKIDDEISFRELPATTAEVTIPTRHGQVAATLYLPQGGAAGRGVHINLHGGGFVMRHPEQDDPICRYLAAKADVTVVNVDYDPAPQLRAPGSIEQALDVARWAAEPERDWDGARLTVGGASAGGALAAGVARLALEEGSPRISLQVLLYPPLDLTVPAKTKKIPGKENFLVRLGPIFDTAYVPRRADRADRLVSPAGPADTTPLDGIAPAVVVTCEKDILREEGIRYAERLERVGALAEHIDLPGVGHGFNILGSPRELVEGAYGRVARHIVSAPGAAPDRR